MVAATEPIGALRFNSERVTSLGDLRAQLGRLQPLDDLPRQRDRHLRAAVQQLLESRLGQSHQNRIANGHHGGVARRIGVRAHFADEPPARHVANESFDAVIAAPVDAQAAADRQVHRVAGIALRHQGFAGGDFHPFKLFAQQGHRCAIDIAEMTAKA